MEQKDKGGLKIVWDELDEVLKMYDVEHPKPATHPKGSIKAAIDKAVKEIGGNK